jgi:co-chaperonin GroES (HSP10)
MSETEKLGYGYKYKQTANGTITPLRDKVIVEEMQFGMQTTSKGLIILSNDGSDHGIKPRWGKVHAVGPEQKEIKVGQYILIEHGRWTRGIELVDPDTGDAATIRMVDNDNILAISDTPMEDSAIGTMSGA